MLILVGLFILLAIPYAILGSERKSGYDEFCKLECWSRRKPCCRTY